MTFLIIFLHGKSFSRKKLDFATFVVSLMSGLNSDLKHFTG